MRIHKRYVAVILLLVVNIGLGLWRPPAAQAATITVTLTTHEDSNPLAGAGCSIYEASVAASTDTAYGGCASGSGADTIVLGSGTYTMDYNFGTDLEFLNDTSIQGVSSAATTINPNGSVTTISGLTAVSAIRNVTFNLPADMTISGSDYSVEDVAIVDMNNTSGGLTISGSNVSVDGLDVNNSVATSNYSSGTTQNVSVDGGVFEVSGSNTSTDGLTATNATNINLTGTNATTRNIQSDSSYLMISGDNNTVEDSSFAASYIDINATSGANIILRDISISNSPAAGIETSGDGGGTTRIIRASIVNSTNRGIDHTLNDGDQHSVYVEDSYIANNQGGGLLNNECGDFSSSVSTMYLTNTHVTGNGASANFGGGINNVCGHVVLNRVTIANNTAADSGGGISNHTDAVLDMTNATISDNNAINGGGLALIGAYIPPSDQHTYQNVTIARNTATNGAGILSDNDQQPLLRNVLLAENVGAQCDTSLTFTAGTTNNISTDATCGSGFTENDTVQLAAALADNGGSTTTGANGSNGNIQTLALLDGSPAINTGTNTNCPAIDARNMTRPQASTCDIGAYEFEFASDDSLAPTGEDARLLRNLAVIGLLAGTGLLAFSLRYYKNRRYRAQ